LELTEEDWEKIHEFAEYEENVPISKEYVRAKFNFKMERAHCKLKHLEEDGSTSNVAMATMRFEKCCKVVTINFFRRGLEISMSAMEKSMKLEIILQSLGFVDMFTKGSNYRDVFRSRRGEILGSLITLCSLLN
jgi:hypothetical protein